MKRRKVLASLATASVLGAGVAAGQRDAETASLSRTDIDELQVKKDGEVVRTVENPSNEEIRELLASTDEDEQLVTSDDDDCVVYCREDCPISCSTCMYACDCFSCPDECC